MRRGERFTRKFSTISRFRFGNPWKRTGLLSKASQMWWVRFFFLADWVAFGIKMIVYFLRWPTSITAKLWSKYCKIKQKIRRHLFLGKQSCFEMDYNRTSKCGKKVVNLQQTFVSNKAKFWKRYGKRLKTPWQKFVDITANVCERHGKSLSTSWQKFGGYGSFLPRNITTWHPAERREDGRRKTRPRKWLHLHILRLPVS